MNREDIIRMAIEAELNLYVNDLTEKQYIEVLEHFAALVASAEREACAKVCADIATEDGWEGGYAYRCVEAIRARGYKQDGQCKYCTDGCPACDARKLPEQEPVACKECHLKDLVYDLLGELKVANLKLSVREKRTWVGLTDEEISDCMDMSIQKTCRAIEAKLKEKNG